MKGKKAESKNKGGTVKEDFKKLRNKSKKKEVSLKGKKKK